MYTEEQYKEFSEKMEQQFPKMYGGRYGGFCIDTGWWPIIEALSNNIQRHIDWKNEQFEKYGRGAEVPQVVVQQIKEKFGGLRFYCQGGDDYVHGMIRMAESWAARSCEVCGKPGTPRDGGWIKTLCDEHELDRQQRMKERFAE